MLEKSCRGKTQLRHLPPGVMGNRQKRQPDRREIPAGPGGAEHRGLSEILPRHTRQRRPLPPQGLLRGLPQLPHIQRAAHRQCKA